MKKIAVFVLCGFFCISSGFASDVKLSFSLCGGWSSTGTGDFGKAILGYADYRRAGVSGFQGELASPNSGTFFGLEALARIHPKLALSLGLGFGRFAADGEVSFAADDVTAAERFQPVASFVAVTVSAHYALTTFGKIQVEPWGGIGLYPMTFHWEQTMEASLAGAQGSDIFVFDGHKTAIGFQAGVDLAYPVTSKLDAFLRLAGRFVSGSEVQGDWTDTGSGDLWAAATNSGTASAWVYERTVNGTPYTLMAFQDAAPSGANAANAVSAKLSMSGLTILIGVRLKWPL